MDVVCFQRWQLRLPKMWEAKLLQLPVAGLYLAHMYTHCLGLPL